MATVVIGDIHGNVDALWILFGKISRILTRETTVVFLGDYIDEGPSTKGVIDRLLEFREEHLGSVRFLKGNHEQWLEKSLSDQTRHSWLLSMGGLATIKSYSSELEQEFRDIMKRTGPALIADKLPFPYDFLRGQMPKQHLAFLEGLELYYENEDCICTHAGLSRDFTSVERETEKSLLWGDADFPAYYTGAKLVVFGHFSRKARLVKGVPKPLVTKNAICIDTSGNGVLTALQLPEKRIAQSTVSTAAQVMTGPQVRTIVILDDQDHALKQVIYEFPKVDKNSLVFRHFDTIESFRNASIQRPFVVFLDFFLSKDREFGSGVIPELQCDHLVCFSSKKEMCDHMKLEAEKQDRSRIGHAYSVQKLKENLENPELKHVLNEIFNGT
jgi:serine/threonine protein phosphatase 1